MVLLMSKNILVIVEGEKREKEFFQQMFNVFDLDYNIVCFKTNIYTLYLRMKKYSFECDIRDVLKEQVKDADDIKLLSEKFLYTYLVFDCDAHHGEEKDKGKNIPVEKRVRANLEKLREMAEYFTNETDPSIGKLYVNYPMVESYRDCDSFFDDSYANRIVMIEDLDIYKSIAGKRKLSSIHLSSYNKDSFISLCKMNIYKLSYIFDAGWKSLRYKEYLSFSQGDSILEKEKCLALNDNYFSVLNTSLFLVVDYFGNKDSYYDVTFGGDSEAKNAIV